MSKTWKNSSQKYSIALYSTLRNKKFTKWKDVHNDIDDLIGEGFSSDAQRKAAFANGYEEKDKKNEGKKRFKRQDGIGKAKYTISYHDGKKKHKDGSDFFDIKIFKNKKDLSDFVGTLAKQGYKLTRESVNEGISVSDERHFGKKGIIIMIDDNGKKVSAIFKDKKNADKFNRNNPSDIKKLLQLAKKTKFPKAIDESVNEATIKGRNNKTGESFGMVIGSDKQGNNGYELTVRKMYNSRISSYGFIFDKDSNLTDIRDYGYSLDGKFPDMKGHASSTSVRPNKRETITQIAKITSPAFAKKIYQHVQKNNKMNESVNEAKVKRPVNRWLELKNDETMHPHKKMAMGLKELKYQLRETEKFFNWYNKIKTMNELDSNQYWKRTNKHIYSIKEKLINIAKTIQEIEK